MRRPPPFPTRQVVTIFITLGLLVAILVSKQRCGRAVESMFRALEPPPDMNAAKAQSRP